MAQTRKMGRSTLGLLRALEQHGGWSSGCGWVWTGDGTTKRMLAPLVKRGLVAHDTRISADGRYTITEAGLEAIKAEGRS